MIWPVELVVCFQDAFARGETDSICGWDEYVD